MILVVIIPKPNIEILSVVFVIECGIVPDLGRLTKWVTI